MNKRIMLVILIVVSVLIIGTGVYLVFNTNIRDDKVEPQLQENLEDEALNVIVEKTGDDKDKYSFDRVDEKNRYVFKKKDNDSIEIAVDVENDTYVIIFGE